MMEKTLCWRILAVVWALGFPSGALADLNQTITLAANTALTLETGATTGAGADILWNGATITPQGNATAVQIGDIPFAIVTVAILTNLPGYSRSPIQARDLAANQVFAVRTNANRYAKVLVTANSGGSITLRFTTFGAPASSSGVPAITAIQNNSSRIPAGYPNYGIAPSSLFVVVGNALADAGAAVLQSSAEPGLPLTLNGASITVVVNGVTTRPALWYTSPGQLAAVLPAATPVGTGTLTVTHNGVASAPAAIQVVASALGINFYSGRSGVVTDAVSGALLTYTNSGSPGQYIVIWATGLGANPAGSDTTFASAPSAVDAPLQIYIGGVLATILYQGSAGYPGVTQINVAIPLTVPTGCAVPLVAIVGNVVSNAVTIPINTGGGACVDALTGLTGNQLSQTGLRTGLVSLVQTSRPGSGGTRTVENSANGAFLRYTGLDAAATGVVPSPGGCVAGPVIAGAVPSFTGLDAGMITLSGPSGLAVTLRSPLGLRGTYNALLAAGAIPVSGGVFTFRGSGGTDVGSFTSTVEFTNPLMSWTNQSAAAAIDRAQGLTVTWSGGNPGTYVVITGTSGTAGGAGPVGGFTCLARVEDGRFTVPSYILLAMPAGPGATELQNYVYTQLSASGLDTGLALGDIAITVDSTYR